MGTSAEGLVEWDAEIFRGYVLVLVGRLSMMAGVNTRSVEDVLPPNS
jgi:hypothetical protein